LSGILAAVDRSDFAWLVMKQAVLLTTMYQSDLTLLTVVKPEHGSRDTMGREEEQVAGFHRELIYKSFPQNGIEIVSSAYSGGDAVYRSVSSGRLIRSKIEHGDPVDRICAVAKELKADVLVVGNRGLGEVGTLLLGSVSEKVVHKCSQSVMVVKAERLDSLAWEEIAQTHRTRLSSR
jgi:nucleotide-binding universal stress UspA family protein